MDNYTQWEQHERQAEAWLASRPICCRCKERIQVEPEYHPDTLEDMCPWCFDELMEEFREQKEGEQKDVQ